MYTQSTISMHALIIISSWKIFTGNNRRNVRALNGREFLFVLRIRSTAFSVFSFIIHTTERKKKPNNFSFLLCDFLFLCIALKSIWTLSRNFQHAGLLIAILKSTWNALNSCFEHCFPCLWNKLNTENISHLSLEMWTSMWKCVEWKNKTFRRAI